MAKRIRKSEKTLEHLLSINDRFYIGITFEDFLKSNLQKYELPKKFFPKLPFLPTAKGSITKANLEGKKIRKQPEEKEIKTIRIEFTNKNGTHYDYLRDYHIYIKIIVHQFKVSLQFQENEHGQKLVTSPELIYDNTKESNTKNTHIINLFYEMFDDFEIYTSNLEPAMIFNKNYDFEILPSGKLTDDDVSYISEGVRRILKKETEVSAFQKRLKIIQEFNPDIRGKGPEGFRGYIVFGFKDKGYVILESMYIGHATYVFNIDTYENLISKNKQDILNNKLAIIRFIHYDSWESNIRDFLTK